MFVKMHNAFFENCARVSLKELGYFSSCTPMWVLSMDEEFFSLLQKYMDDLTCNPLSLVQLCRKVVSANGSSLLVKLFETLERQDIRYCLIHVCYPER